MDLELDCAVLVPDVDAAMAALSVDELADAVDLDRRVWPRTTPARRAR